MRPRHHAMGQESEWVRVMNAAWATADLSEVWSLIRADNLPPGGQ
jgi:hypothetical protein